jgi:uncharacterized protein YndB with AHSA1/START domain
VKFAVGLDRVIAAPRSEVYRAWLDPELLARWMGPDDFSVTLATVDQRVGGRHEVEMVGLDGGHHTFVSTIDELLPDERIVLRFRFHPDAEETLLTITLDDTDGGTALHLQHERITQAGELDGRSVNTGWSQTLAKLQALFVSGA